MTHQKYPTLNQLLGSDWLEYMTKCEELRPPPKRISPYVGSLADLERGLNVIEKRFQSDHEFQNLLKELKTGTRNKYWETFEHAFAIVKEIEMITNRFPEYPLELSPPIKNKRNKMDFRLKIQNQWIYFEIKASPFFSHEQEFLNTGIGNRISRKISTLSKLDPNLFFVICFEDFEDCKISVNDFYKFLESNSKKIDIQTHIFPILLNYPSDDNPIIQIFIVNRITPLIYCNEVTLYAIKESIKYSNGKNHFFNHFAPQGYDLRKRLKNLIGRASNQMGKNNPNVLILYTRDVVLGSIDEIYNNCSNLFREDDYAIIDTVVMNIEDQDQNIRRRIFERQNSKLPVPIDSLL